MTNGRLPSSSPRARPVVFELILSGFRIEVEVLYERRVPTKGRTPLLHLIVDHGWHKWLFGHMDTKLKDLKLRPGLLWELYARGYQTVGDMAHLSIVESLRIPGMGGVSWRRIAKAQGREPFGSHSAQEGKDIS